jgi:hypothetical protein
MHGMDNKNTAEAFIQRWQGVPAGELCFVLEFCDLLGVEKPHATSEQDYMFERAVTFSYGDGSTSAGRIDCYKRGHFILEAKKQKVGSHTKGFDDGLPMLPLASINLALACAVDFSDYSPRGAPKWSREQ